MTDTIARAAGALMLWAWLAPATADAASGIVKSPSDDRSYAAFVLDNGLQVVVVSDPSTDKAAASLDVNVGSGSDPEDRAGLAHFLEHMLFLGTEKYPDAAEYKSFISSHGGGENAYTSFDHTNYFFEINHDHLEAALDRFAQFFIAPRLNPEYVSRERQVVHSEFTSKLKNDGRRTWYAIKQAFNPAHPASRFAVGSNDTLADRPDAAVRDDLLEFYRNHYSAGIMKLAVIGREPLPALRAMVESRFGAVPNTGAKPQRVDLPLFEPGSLPRRLDVKPVRERRRLSFTFPIPAVQPHWRDKPTHFISDLIGHEGTGSLLAALKARGWAEGLSAGIGMSSATSATYNVTMQLTEAGLDHIDEIGSMLFRYVALIREKGVERWRFDELKRLSEMRFRFVEKAPAAALVRSLANDLHYLPATEVLRGRLALEQFKPALIERFLESLRPDNVLVTVVSKDAPASSITDLYEVEYRLSPLADETVAAWRAPAASEQIALPEPNPFIPNDFAMLADGGDGRPVRLTSRKGFEVWHHADTEFGLPRTNFYFSVRSPVANDTPRSSVLTTLYVAMVNDQLNEYSYPANLAGMEYALYKHMRGFTLRFGGYSDNEEMLLERIASTLASPALEADRFAIRRSELARGLRNATKRTPARRAMGEAHHLLLSPSWTEEERLAVVDDLSVDDLRAFVPKLLARLEVVVLAHGNLDRDKATALAGVVERALVARAEPVEVPSGTVVKLVPGDRYVRRLSTVHQDSATVAFFQGGDRSDEARARAALLAEVVSSPFFDVLRTERQLGYVVYSTPMPILEAPGIAFVVQSPTNDPEALAGHIGSFLHEFANTVEAMSEAELARHKASVVSRITEAETRLDERSGRYWTEIDRQRFEFDTRERLARAVEAIDKSAFVDYFRSMLTGAESRGLVVQASGTAHAQTASPPDRSAASGGSLIEDDEAFKAAKGRFGG